MFAPDRWVTGPDQLPGKYYKRMAEALRLASCFLTEDCVLDWFCHLTFGERKRDKSVRPAREYISSTRFEKTPHALEQVKKNLRDLSGVVTFMFAPRSSSMKEYGETFACREDVPFFNRNWARYWPNVDARHLSRNPDRRRWPCVIMTSDFRRYFQMPPEEFKNSSRSLWYRTQFLFAVTLVHEVAHAYAFLLDGRIPEPYWHKKDKHNELGFSWELETFNRAMDPLWDRIKGCSVLFSLEIEPYEHRHEGRQLVRELIGRPDTYWGRWESSQWGPLVDPQDFRGAEWFCGQRPGFRNYVITFQAIPMEWIVSWFQESHWEMLHHVWVQDGKYSHPPIYKTFMLVYQKDEEGVSIHYSLDTTFSQNDAWQIQQLEIRDQAYGLNQWTHSDRDYYYDGYS